MRPQGHRNNVVEKVVQASPELEQNKHAACNLKDKLNVRDGLDDNSSFFNDT